MCRPAIAAFAVILCATLLSAGVVGVFQGRVVLRKDVKAETGILYVESRHGMARKVRVGNAAIEYDEEVPKGLRKTTPAESLCENTLVRVTAEQSNEDDGPWRAITILILPEPKRNGIAPGQSFSFLAGAFSLQETRSPGSKGAGTTKEQENRSRTSGTSGSCWVK